jgi:DNA polymerase-3 subunit epsilon
MSPRLIVPGRTPPLSVCTAVPYLKVDGDGSQGQYARMTCKRHCLTGFTEAVVLDTETTGLDSETDRIVSISALLIDFEQASRDRQLTAKTFNARINPGVPIPEAARRVHGIRDADVAAEQPFSAIADQLREFIGKRPLIGHNVQFDKRFVNAELKRAGHRTLTRNKGYCTQARFKEHMETLYDDRKRFWKLDEMLSEMGIEGRATGTHDASEDALLTAKAAALFYSLDNGYIQGPGRTRTSEPAQQRAPERVRPAPRRSTPQERRGLKDATGWEAVRSSMDAPSTAKAPENPSTRKTTGTSRLLWVGGLLLFGALVALAL